ncbi:UDP-glucosyltransferase family protein [Medicago truncatula]|uniref:UDP-glucosyltransferase family protein n=1 Tax=Medicago truncatula TaxID=3880 RepID=G7LCK2_MEDTR|nr:UDP-glucosyltransferase family protein [Medicago truncatula]
MEKTVHIAVVPGVGYSHLFPILQFSKLLVQLHPYFHVTCFIPSLGSLPTDSKTILETLPSNISCTFLPPVNSNDLPQGVALALQLQLTLTHSLPSIHQALKSLTLRAPFVALVVDALAIDALDFAKEFNLLSYVYYPASVTSLSSYFHLLKLDKETSCEYRDLPEPIQIPGCVPIHGRDFLDLAQDRSSQSYKFFLQCVEKFRLFDGVLINSFLEIEKGPIEAMTDEGSENLLVYAVGPIIQTLTTSGDDANKFECLTWLDKQCPCSVLYVSFGSGGTLSQEQIDELALGLELSNHKFLWVVRAPSSTANAAYLSASDVDPLQFLPSGFLERTKEQGMVVPSWAPQIQILSHSSIGGFLSHCGWNSTLESVVYGVPLITWPLYAEQRTNAVLLCEGLKVGLRPRVNENGIVERVEIAELIKCLMEGEEGGKLRNNMKEFKEAASSVHKEDGSTTKTLSQLALKWSNFGIEKQLFQVLGIYPFSLYSSILNAGFFKQIKNSKEGFSVNAEYFGKAIISKTSNGSISGSSQDYKHFLQHVKSLSFADGVLVNSFLEMEMGPIKAPTEEGSGNPSVYPVGPIIDTVTCSDRDANGLECLSWLDKQQSCSVLYVSFGSGGTLSHEQIVQLALGSSSSAAYLSAQNDGDPLKFLPSGFLERTKEKGFVITSWAPQIQILSHSSIGGFLSHCGWNSTLESVVHGVPLITWPMFAEQGMNAVLVTGGLKVGLRPRVNENGIVERVEVAKVIKCLMEGEECEKLHNNMKELKGVASNALKEDGSSTKTISQLTLKWRNLVQEN